MRSFLPTVPRGIWILAVVAMALRVAFMVATVDLTSEEYNEFGAIAENMRAGYGFALFHYDGETISGAFSVEAEPFPSAFMPPGYVLFVYLLLGISGVVVRNLLLLIIQHIAGVLAVVLVFLLARKVYGVRAAWMAALLAAVLPDMIAASSTFGATSFVHLLVLGLFLLVEKREPPRTWLWAILLGAILGFFVLFRFEALGFALLVMGLVWRASGHKFVLKVAVILVLILTPWIARNAVVFQRPLLSTSLGLNAFRGNNAEGTRVWSDPEVQAAFPALAGPHFEVGMSKAYGRQSWAYATSNPGGTLLRSMKKVVELWTFDPGDDRAKHPVRVLAWVLLVSFALWGCREVRPPTTILLYLLYSTALAAVFFALARHQVLMEIALIPLAGHGLARFCTFLGPSRKIGVSESR